MSMRFHNSCSSPTLAILTSANPLSLLSLCPLGPTSVSNLAFQFPTGTGGHSESLPIWLEPNTPPNSCSPGTSLGPQSSWGPCTQLADHSSHATAGFSGLFSCCSDICIGLNLLGMTLAQKKVDLPHPCGYRPEAIGYCSQGPAHSCLAQPLPTLLLPSPPSEQSCGGANCALRSRCITISGPT